MLRRILLLALVLAGVSAADHPRLLLPQGRLEAIKQAITVKGSPHQLAFAELAKKVKAGDLKAWGWSEKNPHYSRAYLAGSAAFLHLVSGEKAWAEQAFAVLKSIEDSKEGGADAATGYGLARATVGVGYALAYDWCFATWSDAQRAYVRGKLDAALAAWPSFKHTNLGGNKASNWVAVCRGGELLMLLATNQEKGDRYGKVRGDLLQHLKVAYGDMGLSNEGVGYVGYGATFLLPAILAAQSVGDTAFDAELAKKQFWKLPLYTGSAALVTTGDTGNKRMFLQSGVSNLAINDEGFASLCLGLVPAAQRAAYQGFYDKVYGVEHAAGPEWAFEWHRWGRVWSMLHYDPAVKSTDPIAALGHGAADTHQGYVAMRNRVQDQDDVLVGLNADSDAKAGWDIDECFSLGLAAHGVMYFAGSEKTAAGKSGAQTVDTFSTLLVDGKRGSGLGKGIGYEPQPRGGYAIADAGSFFAKLGVTAAKRHLFADFTADGATLSTLDRLEAGAEHDYTWQANLGSHEGDGGIKASSGTESGRPFLLLTSPRGWVKIWVLAPAKATIAARDPARITVRGATTDLWLAMRVGTGAPAKAVIAGDGLATTCTIDGTTLRFDTATARIIADVAAPAKPAPTKPAPAPNGR